jgi:hypothetical protein
MIDFKWIFEKKWPISPTFTLVLTRRYWLTKKINFVRLIKKLVVSGLNGIVVSVAYCYPKGAGFDFRVMLGIFPLRKEDWGHWSDKSTSEKKQICLEIPKGKALTPPGCCASICFLVSVLGTLTNTSSAGTGSNPTIGIQSSIVAVNFYQILSVR